MQRQPTYEQLATVVAKQAALIESLQERVASLEAEVVSLRRQLGRDSSNSSQPPSQDGPAAKARQKSAARGQAGDGQRPQGRRQGGQKGHPGMGLRRVAVPDRQEAVEPPACSGCGAGLAGAPGRIAASVQVFDLPAFAVTVTEYLMMRRVCGCGHATTAAPPPDVSGGPVCYGPNVVAAATFLASQDVIGIERAADLMSALLGVPVSTGFVSRFLARLDDALTAAGFEDALKAALREAEVLGTDETPAPITASGAAAETAETGEDISNPHVFTVRTMRSCTTGGPDLVWFGAAGTRTKKALTAFGILDDYAGVLVRDDFGGYLSYDTDLAGVQQCLSHMLRHLHDAHDIDPATQVWTVQATAALQAAIHATNTARRTGAALDTDAIATARTRFDQAVACGISINLSRPWPKGNHPGLVLAKRLQRKADQVWLFTTRADVPPTNNGSEAAIRGFKLAEKVSGCWRTLTTLQRHCRNRSYLETARNHTRRPLDAIRDALNGTPWMPSTSSRTIAQAA